jgi:hypothetical protein
LSSGQVAFLYVHVAKWSAINSAGRIAGQPNSLYGQEKFDQFDIFSRLMFLIPLNW